MTCRVFCIWTLHIYFILLCLVFVFLNIWILSVLLPVYWNSVNFSPFLQTHLTNSLRRKYSLRTRIRPLQQLVRGVMLTFMLPFSKISWQAFMAAIIESTRAHEVCAIWDWLMYTDNDRTTYCLSHTNICVEFYFTNEWIPGSVNRSRSPNRLQGGNIYHVCWMVHWENLDSRIYLKRATQKNNFCCLFSDKSQNLGTSGLKFNPTIGVIYSLLRIEFK